MRLYALSLAVLGGFQRLRLPLATNLWPLVEAATFRFVLDLSHKLGKIQLFSGNRTCYAMLESKPKVVESYALMPGMDRPFGTQGLKTRAETELQFTCFDYGEPHSNGQMAAIEANQCKIPLLAAKWGLDPACIRRHVMLKEGGVAGESNRRMIRLSGCDCIGVCAGCSSSRFAA